MTHCRRGTLLALLLGYLLAYYLSFHAANRNDLLYQLVIEIPLWASYLVRGYAWKTILGSEGVLICIISARRIQTLL